MIVNKAQLQDLTADDREDMNAIGIEDDPSSEWKLSRSEEAHLCLSHSSFKKMKPHSVDFLSAKTLYKQKTFHNKNQSLVKAVNFESQGDRLLDLTAGFAEDAMIFASLGFEVTAVERQPLIYILVKDALQRLSNAEEVSAQIVGSRIQLVFDSTENFLQLNKDVFKIVYVDPMFHQTKKSALSTGRMQILQQLTADEEPFVEATLRAAVRIATDRLIVKRPLKSQQLLPHPVHAYCGKSVRYDMYKPTF